MKKMTIEKADRKRYRIMVWQTIGLGLFLGLMMFFPGDELFATSGIIEFLRGLGAGLGIAATVKLAFFQRRIKSDPETSEAITNELYRLYDRKALAAGFYVAVVAAFGFFILETASVGIRFQSGIILYLGIMSARTARLIYYR